MPERLIARLRTLTSRARAASVRDEYDAEADQALIDAILQSALFCVSLLALVTCLARLPAQPPLTLQMPDTSMMVNYAG